MQFYEKIMVVKLQVLANNDTGKTLDFHTLTSKSSNKYHAMLQIKTVQNMIMFPFFIDQTVL